MRGMIVLMRQWDQKGVTIIEVLVVLAIVSLVFVGVITFLQSYFGRESFRQGSQLLAGTFNNMIHNVRTDVWPDEVGYECTEITMPADGDVELSVDSTATPGTGKECAFFGQAFQLGFENEDGNPAKVVEPTENYYIHDLIGPPDSTDGDFKTFQVFDSLIPTTPPREIKRQRAPQGVSIQMAYYDTTPKTNLDDSNPACPSPLLCHDPSDTDDWAFLDGFAVGISGFGERGEGGDFLGGSRKLSLWAIYSGSDATPGSDARDSARDRVRVDSGPDNFVDKTKLHERFSTPEYYHSLPHGKAIYVCLISGQGEEKAFIRVGSIKGSLAAEVERDSTKAKIHCPDI